MPRRSMGQTTDEDLRHSVTLHALTASGRGNRTGLFRAARLDVEGFHLSNEIRD
jgi:hypothetical protein